jgi:hypothetical protein
MIVDTLLEWLDDNRLAFTFQDPATRTTSLAAIDTTTRELVVREKFDSDYVGIGSAARGIVLLMRGTARFSVQYGDRWATKLAPMHDSAVQGGVPAGWTPDDQFVFAIGKPGEMQPVRGTPGGKHEPWPGTTPNDRVDSVVDDSVIVHHGEGTAIAIERVGPSGQRTKLAQVAAAALDVVVRCAGSRAAPCVLVEPDAGSVQIVAFDPTTGTRGASITKRRFVQDVAVSTDGKLLALTDGTDAVTVMNIATGASEPPPSAGTGAAVDSVGFSAKGELWGTSVGFQGRLFGLFSFSRSSDGTHFYASPHLRGPARDNMRWYWRPTPRPDGSGVAVAVREFRFDVWRVDGL